VPGIAGSSAPLSYLQWEPPGRLLWVAVAGAKAELTIMAFPGLVLHFRITGLLFAKLKRRGRVTAVLLAMTGGEELVQQIKLFKEVESDISRLEASVNDWIRESEVRVLQVTGNIAPQSGTRATSAGRSHSAFTPSDVMILVTYETE